MCKNTKSETVTINKFLHYSIQEQCIRPNISSEIVLDNRKTQESESIRSVRNSECKEQEMLRRMV